MHQSREVILNSDYASIGFPHVGFYRFSSKPNTVPILEEGSRLFIDGPLMIAPGCNIRTPGLKQVHVEI